MSSYLVQLNKTAIVLYRARPLPPTQQSFDVPASTGRPWLDAVLLVAKPLVKAALIRRLP